MKKLIFTIVLVIGFVSLAFGQGTLGLKKYIDSLFVSHILNVESYSGKLTMILNGSASVAYTVDSCKNIMHVATYASGQSVTLPAAELGLCFGVMDGTSSGAVISLDPNGTEYIQINGASAGAGVAIDSPGDPGDMIILYGFDGYWVVPNTTLWQ